MGDPSTMNSTLRRFSLFEVFKIRCRFIREGAGTPRRRDQGGVRLGSPQIPGRSLQKSDPEQRGQPNPGGMGAQRRRNPPRPKPGHQHPGGAVPRLRCRLLKPTPIPTGRPPSPPRSAGAFHFSPTRETPPGQKLLRDRNYLRAAPPLRGWRAALDLTPHPETAGMRRNNHRDPDSQKQQEKTR